MSPFLQRLLRENGPGFAAVLRNLAAQVEGGLPGPPVFGDPIFWLGKEPHVGQVQMKDTDPPRDGVVGWKDAKGSPTEAEGPVSVESADETIATATISDDGKTVTVTAGSPGDQEAATTQVTARTTNNDGTEAVAVGAVTVTAGEAVVGDISFPEPAPDPAPPTG